jgi:hypothetical protein
MAFNIVIQNIEQYATLASFPAAGNSNILYIDEATSTAYFWDGSAYASVSGGSGTGDMSAAVYDPTGINADAFDYKNFIGLLQITSVIVTESLNSNVDNYNPTNFNISNLLQIEPISTDRDITGFMAPAAGVVRIITVANTSATRKIKFKNNDSSSTAANRLLLRDNGNKDLKKQDTCRFYYDHTASRWRNFGAGVH